MVRIPALAALAACTAAAAAQESRFTLHGNDRFEAFGGALAFIGDVTGDGVADYAVGAIAGNAAPTPHFGAVRIYSGAGHALVREITGIGDENFGWSLAPAGDFDADGVPDLLVGDPSDSNDDGAAFVVSGADGSLLATFRGGSLRARYGHRVVGLGDVDGDGVPDCAIGAPDHFVIGSPAAGLVELVSGASGAVLASWVGTSAASRTGDALADAGDWDQDGVNDLALVELDGLAPIQLRTRVFSGATQAKLMDEFVAPPGGDMLFATAGRAGDVDGDGRDDLIVAGPSDTLFGLWGTAVVYSSQTKSALFQLIDTNGGFGRACSGAGDVDGDGFGDVAVSRPSGVDGGTVEVFSGFDQSLLIAYNQNSLALGVALDGSVDLTGDGVNELLTGCGSLETARSGGEAQLRSLVTGKVIKRQNAAVTTSIFGGAACFLDDANGDGSADLLVSASSRLDLFDALSLRSGTDGSEIERFTMGSHDFGGALLQLPDLDGDALADFAIAAALTSDVEIRSGASGALLRTITDAAVDVGFGRAMAVGVQPGGAVHLAVGSPLFDTARTDIGRVQVYDLATGALVTSATGVLALEQAGSCVAFLGDINADGTGDWAVGAPFNNFNGTDSGRLFAISGATGAQIRNLRGVAAGDRLGTSVAVVGDVNADGFADYAVGAPGVGAGDEGQVLLVSGKNGVTLRSEGGAAPAAELGRSVAGLAHGNGDAIPDLLATWTGRRRFDLFNGANDALLDLIATGPFARTLVVAHGALELQDGPGAGSLVGVLAPDDTTGGARAGALQLFKLDDLYLQVNPAAANANDVVSAFVRGGPPAGPVALFLETVNGAAVNVLLDLSLFDVNGIRTVSDTVPPGLSGTVWELRAFAVGFDGKLAGTQAETLTFL